MDARRQERQRPELAVREVAGSRHDLEGGRTDAARRGEREGEVDPLARLDAERLRRGRRGQPELGEERSVRLGIGDLERRLAGERRFAGAVDHHLELGDVALAQEARQVGADHQLLHRLGVLLDVARGERLRERRHPDPPRGDRIGDGELDRRRAVGAGEQLRLPEGGLGEVGAQGDRRGSGAARRRSLASWSAEIDAAAGGILHVVLHRPAGPARPAGRHRPLGDHRHGGDAALLHPAHRPAAAAAGPADPPGRDLDEGVARERVHRIPLHPRLVAVPERTDGAEVGRERRESCHRSGRGRADAAPRTARRGRGCGRASTPGAPPLRLRRGDPGHP